VSTKPHHTRKDLEEIVRLAMIDRGLEPDFSPAVEKQVAVIPGPAREERPGIRT
jgi:hypothetical protein